ncbi:glycosyltransferase family 2 protein [Algirhabdus cladophorae]|uniref:glycosyltransferase family 2 protein n=1 Tax=Algirhabdus cladophorae TaxID=3377108 RepID=UPI003B848886
MADLTLIIPFYNEEAYLHMAVQSIKAQGLDNTQILVVNDNPETYSQDWFDGYSLPRDVTVLHHAHNRGLSAARNTGLAAAIGEFVGFLDADDYYTTDGLAQQLHMAQETHADITHAPCYLSNFGTPAVQMLLRDRLFFTTAKSSKGLLSSEEAQFITSSWSSLYRRDFLLANDLAFDEEQQKFEDRLFVLQTITAAKSISYLGTPARVWRRRAGSISVTKTDPYIHQLQVQLLEKCLGHIRREVASGALPPRFEKRELFNSVGRLIWDMDILPALAHNPDAHYSDLGQRIQTLLGDDSFGHEIFDDPMLTHISRIGMKTKKGFISREMFFAVHKYLREGAFTQAFEVLTAAAPKPAKPMVPMTPLRKTLVLHLGMHKTGTTFIQHNLHHHRDALLRRGVLVPRTGFDDQIGRGSRVGSFPGHQGLLHALRRGEMEVWQELHREIAQSPASKVLISCENMLYPMHENRDAALAKLTSALGFFEAAEAVAVIRRPDVQIEAFWRELVSNGNPMGARSLGEFINDAAPRLTDLEGLFAPFEAAFGTPVRLLDYADATAQDKLWPAFLKLVGTDLSMPAIAAPRYPTPDRRTTQLAQLATAMGGPMAQRQAVLATLYQSMPKGTGDESGLSPAARQKILRSFEAHDPSFSASRGYAPDVAQWIDALDQGGEWTPSDSFTTADIEAVINARLFAETPQDYASNTVQSPVVETRKIYVPRRRRIRLRPWVRRLLRLR